MKHAKVTPQVEEKKRHRLFSNKYLSFLVFYAITQLIGLVVALVVYFALGQSTDEPMDSITMVVGAVFSILWFYWVFRKEFAGFHQWSTVGMMLLGPCYIFLLGNCIDVVEFVMEEGVDQLNPVPLALIMGLAPGLSEEIYFRAFPGSNWMRVSNTESSILPNVLVTALVFGLIHGLNALAGAAISSTIFQVFYAFCLGVAFEAVFLRCGSILPSVILHTIIDATAFLTMDIQEGGLISEELTINPLFFLTLVTSIALVVWGIYLVRPAKRAEIVALWDKKWHKAS